MFDLTIFNCRPNKYSNTADEIKSIDQAVEYILAQPEGKLPTFEVDEVSFLTHYSFVNMIMARHSIY